MNLTGKNAIVTGGGKGIGKRLAEKLANENATVGVFDIDTEALDTLKAEDPRLWCRACDVTDNGRVAESVEAYFSEFGAIDILVNNAGVIADSPLISFSEGKIKKHDIAVWDRVIATNLSSAFYVTLHVAEKMLRQRTRGVVVNVSSISAAGNVGQGAYSAAKAGVKALTVTWSKELGPFGIRVAGIAPGFTKTDAVAQSMSSNVLNDWIKRVPLRRLATPDEIADGVLFIIHNDFFHGKILELDGGLRM